jgi:hypothetical protein
MKEVGGIVTAVNTNLTNDFEKLPVHFFMDRASKLFEIILTSILS